jgi:hypothetical protein
MIIHHDIPQNSEDWSALRAGKFTASSFSDLFAKKDTKTYQKAIIKVAYEIVTGESEESFSNKWMQRGHEREQEAAEQYEILTFSTTEDAGFYEFNKYVGASPDRKIVGLNGGIEIKNPSHQVYNDYLKTSKLPTDYFWQVHGQLLCTGWDFIDYMPYSSPKLKQILTRVERDEIVLEQLLAKLDECIKEVEILVEQIRN